MMDEIKTKNMIVCITEEDNYCVIKCGSTSVTYPLDEMRKVFNGF